MSVNNNDVLPKLQRWEVIHQKQLIKDALPDNLTESDVEDEMEKLVEEQERLAQSETDSQTTNIKNK